MISRYLREETWYRRDKFFALLKYGDENDSREINDEEGKKYDSLVKILCSNKIMKRGKKIDSIGESSDEYEDENEEKEEEIYTEASDSDNDIGYTCKYVGIIVIDGYVFKCYPKYLPDKVQPKDEMRKTMKVLEKYRNSKKRDVQFFIDNDENEFDILAIMLQILRDYYENGIYTNTEKIKEINGSGEILWDKTVNETYPLISHNRPYYTDLWTRRRVNNEYDYFKRLHECVLTKISADLEDADLIDIFGLTAVNLTDETLDDFGDKEYILYRLRSEMNMQFNTRKQNVLKYIYAYISNSKNLNDHDNLSLYGTYSFHTVWEKICAEIFNNKLDETLQEIEGEGLLPSINLDDTFKGRKKSKLIDLIDYPKWGDINASGTLIPDIISIKKLDGSKTEDGKYNYQFVILDAKYYTPIFYKENGTAKIKGQPGVESVTKQYLYQKAYEQFLVDHGFSIKEDVKNCLIFPMVVGDQYESEKWKTYSQEENEAVVYINKYAPNVTMNQLFGDEFVPVQVRFLSADWVYKMYLNGDKVDDIVETLQLDLKDFE